MTTKTKPQSKTKTNKKNNPNISKCTFNLKIPRYHSKLTEIKLIHIFVKTLCRSVISV